LNISQAAKQIWESQREKTHSLPLWKDLPSLRKQQFICEVWLISYLIQHEKEKSCKLRDRN
jgi:hypothetical protein